MDKHNELNYEQIMYSKPNHLKIYTIKEIEAIGSTSGQVIFEKPTKNDLAVIMYTSGSTGILKIPSNKNSKNKKIINTYLEGNPKGVMISHGNILVITKALMKRIGSVRPEEHTYIGYLPLAHVLELVCEFTYLINGIKIGYATAQTIMDTSLGVKPGELGDLRTLNPSLMSAVPLVYGFSNFFLILIIK